MSRCIDADYRKASRSETTVLNATDIFGNRESRKVIRGVELQMQPMSNTNNRIPSLRMVL
ncbi:MAG TPA: hypothetical protein VEF33_15085 [Syntrophales bacterium]|nr:hypothetical protein [Syntrophales bacterium]